VFIRRNSKFRERTGGPHVPPFHAASGVGYGTSRVAQQHRHAPDGRMPAAKYFLEELGVDVNVRDADGFTALSADTGSDSPDIVQAVSAEDVRRVAANIWIRRRRTLPPSGSATSSSRSSRLLVRNVLRSGKGGRLWGMVGMPARRAWSAFGARRSNTGDRR
jgi:hypothetical protein